MTSRANRYAVSRRGGCVRRCRRRGRRHAAARRGSSRPRGAGRSSRVAADGSEERLPAQLVDRRRTLGSHRRRPGRACQQGDLADSVASVAQTQRAAFARDVQRSVGDDVVGVARVALSDQHLSRLQVAPLQRHGHRLQRRRWQRPEHPHVAQQADLHDGNRGRCVHRHQPAGAEERHHGQDQRDPDDRTPVAAQDDEDRHQQGADGEGRHGEALELPEDPTQQVRRHRALQQCPARHVEQRPEGAHHGQQERRGPDARRDGDQRQAAPAATADPRIGQASRRPTRSAATTVARSPPSPKPVWR